MQKPSKPKRGNQRTSQDECINRKKQRGPTGGGWLGSDGE
jgi:hypothetical protein